MGFLEYLDVLEEDDLFIIKYGLIIANFITIFFLLLIKSKKQQNQTIEAKHVLIVTAHPDDETMFFIPTIQYLLNYNYIIHLLCLTTGNANNLGKIREIELEKCSKYLGIQHLKIINNQDIQDSMTLQWPMEKVKEIIKQYVQQNNINGIITFDNYGISGHINHRQCNEAVNQLDYADIKKFKLESTNILRKYSSIFDFFISSILSDQLFIHFNMLKVWKAMQIHRSQFVWYRRLFVVFSRYSYINTLKAF